MSKKILIVLIILVCLVIGGVFVYKNIFQPKPEKGESDQNGSWQKITLASSPPTSYQLEVPLYQQNNFCYGASAMMIARYWGLTEEKIQELKQLMISGKGLMGPAGAPPIIIPALAEFNLGSSVYLGYLKGSDLNPLKMWTHGLDNSEEQVKTFSSSDEALLYLKRLIASKIPVIAIVEWDLAKPEGAGEEGAKNDHFTVVVGYDENHIYTNDPSPDRGSGVYAYTTADFLERWNLRGTTSRQAAFLGDYGMIFLKPKAE